VSATAGTLAGMLESVADRVPEAVALIDDSGSLTFAQLQRRVSATAGTLNERIDPNETVAVVGANHRIWVELYYGAPAAGRTLVFLNHRLHARELRSMLERSNARLLIGDPNELDRLRDINVDLPMFGWSEWSHVVDDAEDQPELATVDPTTSAWLLFTSGTTAAPKGAVLTHSGILAAVAASSGARPVDADDVYVFPFPLCHVAGYNVIHRHSHGRPVVLMSGFVAEEFCDIVEREQVTSTSLAATMLATLVELIEAEPARLAQLRSLRSLAYGAAPMPTPLLRRADSLLGVEFAQGYGMTELSGNAVFLNAAAHRRGLEGESGILEAAGEPAPGVELRLVDDDDNDVAEGKVGEILVRAAQVMKGYLNDQEATDDALRGGWLHTGDMGRLVGGLLYVVDRKKDIIITGGENVSSLEVEIAVLEHPSVARVAVVGVPDSTWGENVCAVVVSASGEVVDPKELVVFVRTKLAGFKVPRHVVVVDELPVTASGKVVKAQLRKRLGENPELIGHRL
jgi:acyl-CoA synthetase (AMP-forming)/AMP-acid ligase II